jgi:hypothetical protein
MPAFASWRFARSASALTFHALYSTSLAARSARDGCGTLDGRLRGMSRSYTSLRRDSTKRMMTAPLMGRRPIVTYCARLPPLPGAFLFRQPAGARERQVSQSELYLCSSNSACHSGELLTCVPPGAARCLATVGIPPPGSASLVMTSFTSSLGGRCLPSNIPSELRRLIARATFIWKVGPATQEEADAIT